MSFLTRIGNALGLTLRAVEGEYRPGPYHLPITGGWLPAGAPLNYWQCGIDPTGGNTGAMVEACVSAYAQTVAMLPGDHWRALDNGGRERVTTSALTRILRRPNSYQSISDFLLALTRSLYTDGNAYGLALRNNRQEIDSLHLFNPRSCYGVAAETGDVFYSLQGNPVVDPLFDRIIVPARDVLHLRINADDNPLRGKSPLEAATFDIASSNAMVRQQLSFYLNQARPSQVLTTDMMLSKVQVEQLREAWNAQAQGLAQGGTPILTAGLKPFNLSATGHDAAIAEMLKLTDQHIALVFGVPLQILGIGGQTYGSTELLMQQWLAQSLIFLLNHIEEAAGNLFGLRGQPEEYLELNTQALLRPAYKERIEALARGVQGGIFAPNEARAELELPKADFGDEPRVQQQVVPLSAAGKIPAAPPAPGAPPAPAPDPDKPEEDGEDDDEAAAKLIEIIARDTARQ